ncbi:MAG: hypothetical protein JXR61_09080 [Prolixibacteraceae bacterium]|nr:hypothetical protein [Prolixibacteraceae bacterium]
MNKKENFFDTDELLDEVLKSKPEFSLSNNFADRIAEKVERKFAWQQYFMEFLIYLGALIGIGGVLAGMSFLWFGLKLDIAISYLLSNISLIGGLAFLVVFILFTDRVLLRYFTYLTTQKTGG